MLRDLRHALRLLIKHKGPTTAAVVALALGIGANAAVFSVVDAMLLRPLPLADLDRLVDLSMSRPRRGDFKLWVAPATFLDWRTQTKSHESVAAMAWWDVNLTGGGDPERVQGFLVSASFFRTLGITPSLGRAFQDEEEQTGRDKVVVLSHHLWQRRFGGDPLILQRTIQLDSIPYTIVGVAPAGFNFPLSNDLWAPLAFDAETAANRRSRNLTVVGRLKPGVSVAAADAELQLIAGQLEKQYPQTNTGYGADAVPLVEGVQDEGNAEFLTVLQGTAMFVLLIACANVANLLLARGSSRQKELALRVALGASRGRLIRQLLTESVVLALVGAGVSLLVASIGIDLIREGMPATIRRFIYGWNDIDVDGRVLAFTTGVAVLAGLIFGLAPAWQGSRAELAETLKEGGRTSAPGRARMRATLVVAEVALALMLLVSAGLLIRGAFRLINADRGYEPAGVLTVNLVLPDGKYHEEDTRRQFFRSLLPRLAAIPQIEASAASNIIPFNNNNRSNNVVIEGQPPVEPGSLSIADYRSVTPDYFRVMRIPLLRGRLLTAADNTTTQRAAVISDQMARRYWPDQDPIGKRFKVGPVESTGPWITVVGTVGDVLHHWFNSQRGPTFYVPFEQSPELSMVVVARVRSGDPTAIAPIVRQEFAAVDPQQPIFRVRSMERAIADSSIGLSYIWVMMAVFGVIALILAAVGVYAVIAYGVSQRTHEFGVRIALGAARRDVLGLVVRHALTLAGIGLAIGLVGAYGLGRLLAANMFGIVSMDASTFVIVGASLTAIAAIAGYVPARRATRVDPAIALRHE
ncbi:MAG: ABC transporter permease [Vicinamibacterales bacterium]